jgi:acetylornithine deacetylase
MNKDLLKQVWEAIDPLRLRQTLMDMVNIYSPSGKEEDIQLYIESSLKEHGLSVTRQEVEDTRYNLYTTIGKTPPNFILVGHVDTVPAWNLDDYYAQESWGVVRGLGAADMKGGCAAMLEAWFALASLPEGMVPPVGLLFVVGEEESTPRFLNLAIMPSSRCCGLS